MNTPEQKIAILVHGFNVKDSGAETIDTLKPYLKDAGYEIVEFDYNWTGVLRVRLCNGNLAKALASISHSYSGKIIAFGHSNGCAIINEAAHLGARFYRVVYISPALDKNTRLAPHIDRACVWYSSTDYVVKLSRWLIGHSWGEMGATGYIGPDRRHFNYNKRTMCSAVCSSGHSDIFEFRKIKIFGPKIIEEAERL